MAGKKVPTSKKFVEQGDAQEAKRSGGPRGPVGRATVERADGRTLRRIQIYFDADVAKRLRHHCVEHDVDMSAYVNNLVRKTLE